MAGGWHINTTVMPFIIRGISLLGINSAQCPTPLRKKLWKNLSKQWLPKELGNICQSIITPDALPNFFNTMLAGKNTGRIVVKIT